MEFRNIAAAEFELLARRQADRYAVELKKYVSGFTSRVPDREGRIEVAVPWSRRAMHYYWYEIPGLIQETRDVLSSQARHAQAAPPWAIPLPVGDDISPMLHADSGAMCLLGRYACSLMCMSYDYAGHPSFFAFGCGVMAHPRAPANIRDDEELRAEVPAKELPGLCARLVWFGRGLPARVRAEVLDR